MARDRSVMAGIIFTAKGRAPGGFTLIELMIVLAIAAILAAVALPAYTSHVVKSRRVAAQACMVEHSQFMERYYTTKMSYKDATLPAGGCAAELAASYQFSIDSATLTDTAYKLVGTPQGAQVSGDSACGTLYLTSAGAKTTSTSSTTCWK